jgi:hypothetical protein
MRQIRDMLRLSHQWTVCERYLSIRPRLPQPFPQALCAGNEMLITSELSIKRTLDNSQAWQAILGRPLYQEDINDANEFVLGIGEDGLDSYRNRPKGKGNLVIGVAKLRTNEPPPQALLSALEESKGKGGQTSLLVLCNEKLPDERIRLLYRSTNALFVMEEVPYEPFGIAETITLKQILQLISNGSMILMDKVHGNQMIDVKASNNKLKSRCLRLIKGIWNEFDQEHSPTDKALYWYISHVLSQKASYEDRGMYTPSTVKIVLTMLANNWDPDHFVQAVQLLHDNNERVDKLLEKRRQNENTSCTAALCSRDALWRTSLHSVP